jgi:NCS family uracil:cation symporter
MNLLLTSIVMGVGVSTASLTIGTVTLRGMALATVIAIVLSISFRIILALRGQEQKKSE